MSKKKIAVIFTVLCLAAAASVRIYMVNTGIPLPVTEIYKPGDIVSFDDNFMDSSEDGSKGYTLQVLDSEIIPVKEMNRRYDLTYPLPEDGHIRYVYLVKTSCGNLDNMEGTAAGISLMNITLLGTNYLTLLDDMLFEDLNPDLPGYSFSLRPGTSKEVFIPYLITDNGHIMYEWVVKDPPKLELTEYPVRKLITLQ